MSTEKLKTALLGLTEGGLSLLEAALATGYFEIQAVADRDTDLAQKTAQKYDCRAYDDYRQLIIQNQLDALLVTAPLHSCAEHVQAAMKKKFNIFKPAPLARNFEEAAQLFRIAKEEKINFTVGNFRRFGQSFIALREFLQNGRIEQIYLITAFCALPGQCRGDWHSDPKLAGGGVLLQGCYEMIDQILWNFSIPQQVYSLSTNQAPDRRQRLYLAEDTVVVTMKFSEALVANLIASNTFGPKQESLKIYGKNKNLTVTNTKFTVCDNKGRDNEALEEFEYADKDSVRIIGLLKKFAESILLPGENKPWCTAKENLSNMAVIESAYLSTRTGMPESPGRILQMA